METLVQTTKQTMSTQLRDIRQDITWSKVARRYFGKSASWMYNKLNGIDGNGNEGEFNYEERIQLRNALYDVSERIRNAAQSIET
ncbi:MAG: DUF5053 domain-containing protein [Prevotellaceae bacterium]|jgi:hypothetical protein|nr:DUF5053 domain-containing protein [Prevotellaceae bacterium]